MIPTASTCAGAAPCLAGVGAACAATAAPALEARGLAIGHRQKRIGEGIDLMIRSGEVLCLLGPNGSGKTTLFRTLLGVLPALSGSVQVGGRPLREWSRAELASRIAYVPQSPAMPFAFTLEELVLMGRAAHVGPFAQPSPHDCRVAAQALAALGVGHLAACACTEVSGGERQLALIARALAQEAGILILDEPTSSLDFGNQLRVLDCIGALRAEGVAVLMSTHQPEHALRVADRIAFLRSGCIVRQGGPDVVAPRALAELYGTDEALVAAGMPGFGGRAR